MTCLTSKSKTWYQNSDFSNSWSSAFPGLPLSEELMLAGTVRVPQGIWRREGVHPERGWVQLSPSPPSLEKGLLLSAFSVADCRVSVHSRSQKPVDYIHGFSPGAPSSLSVNRRVFNPKENGLLGEQWFGWMRENDSLMKYNLWMDALARLAKSCLLWHYVSFLRLFFFKGKEKLKSPLRIEDECIWHKGGERRVWDCPSFPGKGNRTVVASQKTVSCAFPGSLGGLPDQLPPSPPFPSQHPHQASFSGPHTELQVSWRELFWVRSILACLPVCTTECCRVTEGWDLRLVADTTERGSFPLSGDSLSHRPSF